MKLLPLALALSTLCLTACETTRVVAPVKPPAERIDCREIGTRPAIPAEYVIDWAKVTTVAQARSEHEAFVRSVRTREGIVAGHVVEVEGRLFACSTDAAWLRDFFKALPEG